MLNILSRGGSSRRRSCGHRASVERLEERMLMALTPVGTEFRVNSTTLFDQVGAAVAADADGDFIVVWASADPPPTCGTRGTPGPVHDVYAQRYNSAGIMQGAEFRVNTTTVNDQTLPDVAMDAAGNFVVAWASVQDGSGFGIYVRRYNASGAPLSGEFRVNTYTTSTQGSPSIALDADGDFVVAWDSYGQEPGTIGTGVYAQRYNSAGVAQGGEMHVNVFTSSYQRTPEVAVDPVGNFTIVWDSFDQDGSSIGIYMRRFSAAGTALSGDVQVNVFTNNVQYGPSIAADDAGNLVVAWTSRDQDGSSDGVYLRRFNSAGTALSGDVRVNTFTTSNQRRRASTSIPRAISSSRGTVRDRTARSTASTRSNTIRPARRRAGRFASTRSQPAGRPRRASRWTPTATSSSPGRAIRRMARAPESTRSATTPPRRRLSCNPALTFRRSRSGCRSRSTRTSVPASV